MRLVSLFDALSSLIDQLDKDETKFPMVSTAKSSGCLRIVVAAVEAISDARQTKF